MKKSSYDNFQVDTVPQFKIEKPLTTFNIALENIKKRFYRSVALSVVSAIIAFVLFSCLILSFSIKNGLGSLKARLGADLLVVPVGYDKGIEGLLLKGEPSYFYFDKSVEDKIKNVQGVRNVSAQFFLTSLNQDCCAVPVQFIGFDPKTDFSIQPWISKSYSKSIKDGELVIGSDISIEGKHELKFFNENYTVAARLEKTGTGLDQAVYANMNTLSHLFTAAKKSGLTFIKEIDSESSISSVLVKIEDGYSLEEVTHNIRSSFDGLQVVKSKNMIGTIASGLKTFSIFTNIFLVFFFAASLIMFSLAFSLSANERKKEFAVYRALGASSKKLTSLVLTEISIICVAGGFAGTVASAIVVIPFTALIGRSLSLPFLLPVAPVIIGTGILSVAVSAFIGPLSAAREVIRLNKREVYLTIKEGE